MEKTDPGSCDRDTASVITDTTVDSQDTPCGSPGFILPDFPILHCAGHKETKEADTQYSPVIPKSSRHTHMLMEKPADSAFYPHKRQRLSSESDVDSVQSESILTTRYPQTKSDVISELYAEGEKKTSETASEEILTQKDNTTENLGSNSCDSQETRLPEGEETLNPISSIFNNMCSSQLNSTSTQFDPKNGQFQNTSDGLNLTCSLQNPTLALLNSPVEELNPTLEQLNPTLDQLNPTLEQLNPTLDQLNPTLEQLNPILEQLNPTLDQLNPTLEQLNPTLEQLNPTLEQLNLTLGQQNSMSSQIDPTSSQLFDASQSLFADTQNSIASLETVSPAKDLRPVKDPQLTQSSSHSSVDSANLTKEILNLHSSQNNSEKIIHIFGKIQRIQASMLRKLNKNDSTEDIGKVKNRLGAITSLLKTLTDLQRNERLNLSVRIKHRKNSKAEALKLKEQFQSLTDRQKKLVELYQTQKKIGDLVMEGSQGQSGKEGHGQNDKKGQVVEDAAEDEDMDMTPMLSSPPCVSTQISSQDVGSLTPFQNIASKWMNRDVSRSKNHFTPKAFMPSLPRSKSNKSLCSLEPSNQRVDSPVVARIQQADNTFNKSLSSSSGEDRVSGEMKNPEGPSTTEYIKNSKRPSQTLSTLLTSGYTTSSIKTTPCQESLFSPQPSQSSMAFKSPPLLSVTNKAHCEISPSTACSSDVFPVKSSELLRRRQQRLADRLKQTQVAVQTTTTEELQQTQKNVIALANSGFHQGNTTSLVQQDSSQRNTSTGISVNVVQEVPSIASVKQVPVVSQSAYQIKTLPVRDSNSSSNTIVQNQPVDPVQIKSLPKISIQQRSSHLLPAVHSTTAQGVQVVRVVRTTPLKSKPGSIAVVKKKLPFTAYQHDNSTDKVPENVVEGDKIMSKVNTYLPDSKENYVNKTEAVSMETGLKFPPLLSLIQDKVLIPATDVLSVQTQDWTYRATLLEDGMIKTLGGEVMRTPVQWLRAVTGGECVKKGRAYREILYADKPLRSYIEGETSVNEESLRRYISTLTNNAQRRISPATQEKEKCTPSAVSHVTDILYGCKLRLLSREDVVPCTDLPENFWVDDFSEVRLTKSLCREVDCWT